MVSKSLNKPETLGLRYFVPHGDAQYSGTQARSQTTSHK